MDYKKGKWAEEILNAQLKDGSWGYFHCFAMPLKNKLANNVEKKCSEISKYITISVDIASVVPGRTEFPNTVVGRCG